MAPISRHFLFPEKAPFLHKAWARRRSWRRRDTVQSAGLTVAREILQEESLRKDETGWETSLPEPTSEGKLESRFLPAPEEVRPVRVAVPVARILGSPVH